MTEAISTRNFTVIEIPKTLHREIKPYAVLNETSVKSVVIRALTEFMEKVKKENNLQNNITRTI